MGNNYTKEDPNLLKCMKKKTTKQDTYLLKCMDHHSSATPWRWQLGSGGGSGSDGEMRAEVATRPPLVSTDELGVFDG